MQKRGCSSIKTAYPLFFFFQPSSPAHETGTGLRNLLLRLLWRKGRHPVPLRLCPKHAPASLYHPLLRWRGTVHWQYEYPTCFIGTVVEKTEQVNEHGSETRDHKDFIIDKKTLKGGFYKVYNDYLDGEEAYWFKSVKNGYYIRNVDPDILKEEPEAALKKTDLSPEVRERVSTLANSIRENDNNYLLIGRMKQAH